jgi:H+/Cl- antiporter ClcA
VLVAAAAVVGALTGLLVAGMDYLVIEQILAHVRERGGVIVVLAPGVGLVIAALVLRWSVPGASPGTTDDYIRGATGRAPIEPTSAPGKAFAVIGTVGLGAALGLEGPAMYLGGALGVAVAERFRRYRLDADLLLVAGAAAGVAGLLGQPLLGALLAVEIPYRFGIDAKRLGVAAVGAIAGFATFRVALKLPPLITVRHLTIDVRLIIAAVIAGAAGSLIARALGALIAAAKEAAASVVLQLRLPFAVGLVAVCYLVSVLVDGDGTTLGPGGAALSWALDPKRATVAALVVVLARLVATPSAIVGGGAGGLLVPLLAVGAVFGRAVAGPVAPGQLAAVAALGAAACIAAGYRVPISAVAYATVALGSVGAVIPALVAVGVAMALGPGVVVSPAQAAALHQRPTRPRPPVVIADTDAEPEDWG